MGDVIEILEGKNCFSYLESIVVEKEYFLNI